MRLLLVDDSRMARATMRRALRRAQIGVLQMHEAEDGQAALTILSEHPVDLVLCDWQMPGMSGLEFLRQKAKLPELADIPVVMISAEGHPGRIQEAMDCGARRFLRKPLTRDDLLGAVLALKDAA